HRRRGSTRSSSPFPRLNVKRSRRSPSTSLPVPRCASPRLSPGERSVRAALVAYAALVGLAAPACAWRNQQSRASGEAGQGPKQLRPGQIIVALAADRGEDLSGIRRELAEDYGLLEVGNFLLGSVQLECVVFEPLSDQPFPDLLERLSRDQRVKLAQPNQV